MDWKTTATIHDEQRRQFWLGVLGTDTVPIKSVVPTFASLPGFLNTQVYLLDIDKLSAEQQDKLLVALATKFDVPEDEAREEFRSKGVPILSENVSVSTTDHATIANMVFDNWEDELGWEFDPYDGLADDDEEEW